MPKFKAIPKVPKNPGAVGNLSKHKAQKLWKDLEHERLQEEKAQAEGRSYKDERDQALENQELQDSWRKLIAEAKIRFPEPLADKFELTPNQKLVGIATMLGWTQNKIHKASGFSRAKVKSWLANPALKEFMEAFEYYQGTKDGKDMIKREIYPSIQILKDIRDDLGAPASVRRDISQWFFEQLYGKAKETREVKGQSIKELTRELMKAREE